MAESEDAARARAGSVDAKERVNSVGLTGNTSDSNDSGNARDKKRERRDARWSFGILRDSQTDEVPGSVLLLSKVSKHNAPLGLQNAPARTSASSLPSIRSASRSQAMFGRPAAAADKKRTGDGKIILEPQPEESMNDPLNWSVLKRDLALFSLSFYCMVGGGMTPILAAGFTNVADTYGVTEAQVALTTGLYMMGLGLGSVIASPTAIAFGKRPVYLVASVIFMVSAVWCALSPNYPSLVVARIFQGLAVSPVECLPSATIAEIFFLHERAYRLGIYTLLLLGGKNLIPLVSAAIIQSLGWRWVFWMVAIVVGFCFFLLFFFVPETFWDRSPQPHNASRRPSLSKLRKMSSHRSARESDEKHEPRSTAPSTPPSPHAAPLKIVTEPPPQSPSAPDPESPAVAIGGTLASRRALKHARFNAPTSLKATDEAGNEAAGDQEAAIYGANSPPPPQGEGGPDRPRLFFLPARPGFHEDAWRVAPQGGAPATPQLHGMDSPYYTDKPSDDYFSARTPTARAPDLEAIPSGGSDRRASSEPGLAAVASPVTYTKLHRARPPKTFVQTLRPYSGRLNSDNWFRVAARPFFLFAYPAVLWSAAVYALSIGWLIVLSEAVSAIYRDPASYNFTPLQTGLVYVSPFVGGILGTVVAGKVSDAVVRAMARRNGGVYEPEFRLVMALPVALSTAAGLMGFGWAAQARDAWIVPTVFFGLVSFGCSLGSTTAITFAVDSYRQYAGEALVTLNFSKNIFHGLVFSLFFNNWLAADGSRTVFVALGGIQLFFLLWTVPMYIFGKRARMWTVRRNFMERW